LKLLIDQERRIKNDYNIKLIFGYKVFDKLHNVCNINTDMERGDIMFRVDKKRLIINKIKWGLERGATYTEISEMLNDSGIKTISGDDWTRQNLFNYYKRNK